LLRPRKADKKALTRGGIILNIRKTNRVADGAEGEGWGGRKEGGREGGGLKEEGKGKGGVWTRKRERE